MEDKRKTIHAKKKLRRTFSAMVFWVAFTLSFLFVTGTYFWIRYQQFRNFSILAESIEDKKIPLETVVRLWEGLETNNDRLDGNLNYVVLENGRMVKKYLTSEISSAELENVVRNGTDHVFQKGKYLSKRLRLDGQEVVLFSVYAYGSELFWRDALLLFMVSTFTAWFFYALLWKYIDRLFVPVEENISSMNEFVHNAGHELQTPLSEIVSNIDFYTENKQGNDFILREIKDEAIKMGNLIRNLLNLSYENYDVTVGKFNLEELLLEAVNTLEEKRKTKNVTIILDVEPETVLESNRDHLLICVTNVLWNAIKYNVDRGSVRVGFANGTITVEDTGIWMSETGVAKAFDRFYKEDASRNSEGFWIWLSLVKKLSDLNGWECRIESEKGKWTRFILKL